KAALPPQEPEQREQRKPQNGEMVALDLLEQMAAKRLELVAPDARRHSRAGRVEIGVEEALRQRPHGEPRHVRMAEHYAAIARDRDRRMQLMGPAAERAQLLARRLAVLRLGETGAAQRERLVGADDEAARDARACDARLLAREQQGGLARVAGRCARLDGPLVDIGGRDLERNA